MPRKTKEQKGAVDRLRQYDRTMLRGQFVSLFWGVICARKEAGELTLAAIAHALGVGKSVVSKWFGTRDRPNWQSDTIADIAYVLNLEIEVTARDRQTGVVYSAAGILHTASETSPVPVTDMPVFRPPSQATAPAMNEDHEIEVQLLPAAA
jgi:hypothetical protein